MRVDIVKIGATGGTGRYWEVREVADESGEVSKRE